MKAIIPETIAEEIKSESAKHPNEETGGMLIGKETDGVFIIAGFIGPGPNAHHSPGLFSYDNKYQMDKYLKVIRDNKDIEVLGWVHKHPGLMDFPSHTDMNFSNQVFDSEEWKEWQFSKLLMPIITNHNNNFKITCYVITKEKREIEKIPIETVPDSHPEIQALTTPQEEEQPSTDRLDAEIEKLQAIGLKPGVSYDEKSRLILITAETAHKPPLMQRDIFSSYQFRIEFRLHRTYPLTKPAAFLTTKRHCTPIADKSEILKTWSPAHCLADIIHYDFPNLIYPIKPLRRKHGSPDF